MIHRGWVGGGEGCYPCREEDQCLSGQVWPHLPETDLTKQNSSIYLLQSSTGKFAPESLKWVRTADLELTPDLPEFRDAVLE